MNVNYMFSLIAVIVLGLLAYVGGEVANWSRFFFGIIIPLLAVIVFIIGVVYRVLYWARSPVPFRIPTTAGQQKTLPWIKYSYTDNPSNTLGVILRMFLEVVTFRSLFRNTKSAVNNGTRISYKLEIWLWVAALAFHYSFLVVITRKE